MSIPIAKLLALTMKTLSKPIAQGIKSRAVYNSIFKKICISVGEFSNKTTYNLNKFVNRYKVPYRPIDNEHAVNKGADMLGEIVVYSIAGVLIVEEYARTTIQKKHNEQAMQDRLDTMEKNIEKIKASISSK